LASAKNRTGRAIEEMADVAEAAAKMRTEGISLALIAVALDAVGVVTRQGSSWTPTQVKRVLNRAGISTALKERP
jgi:hypothetical protein